MVIWSRFGVRGWESMIFFRIRKSREGSVGFLCLVCVVESGVIRGRGGYR